MRSKVDERILMVSSWKIAEALTPVEPQYKRTVGCGVHLKAVVATVKQALLWLSQVLEVED